MQQLSYSIVLLLFGFYFTAPVLAHEVREILSCNAAIPYKNPKKLGVVHIKERLTTFELYAEIEEEGALLYQPKVSRTVVSTKELSAEQNRYLQDTLAKLAQIKLKRAASIEYFTIGDCAKEKCFIVTSFYNNLGQLLGRRTGAWRWTPIVCL